MFIEYRITVLCLTSMKSFIKVLKYVLCFISIHNVKAKYVCDKFIRKARHQNELRKVFLQRFPLSRFLAKIPRVNKIKLP